MNEQEKQEVAALKIQVKELSDFISLYFNPDGTMKNPPLVIEAGDAVATPVGTIRVQTNLGPKNILIAA